MNDEKNANGNAFQNASGTPDGTVLVGARARGPLLSTELPASSRSDAQTSGRATETTHISRLAAIHEHDALAKIVITLRPDWTAKAVLAWIANDDRPWAEVCRAALRSDDRDIRHPNGLRFIGADYDGAPTPLPPSLEEWRNAKRCAHHGAIATQCALCRRGIGAS